MDLNEKIMKRLLQTFKVEAREHIQLISNKLIVYETEKDKVKKAELIEEIYRAAHSLKGAARAVGLNQIVDLCQNIENVFSGFKKGELKEARELFDSTLKGVQMVSEFVEEEDAEKRLAMENEILVYTTEIADLILKNESDGNEPKEISVNMPEEEKTAEAKLPEQKLEKSKDEKQNVEINKIPGKPAEPLPEKNKIKSPSKAPTDKQTKATQNTVEIAENIRVSVKKLENLYNQAEELVAVKQAFRKHTSELSALQLLFEKWNKKWNRTEISFNKLFSFISDINLEPALLEPLKDLLNFVEYNESLVHDLNDLIFSMHEEAVSIGDKFEINLLELNDTIKESLLLPANVLTDQFPLMVRDIANELGKEITFNVSGDSIELDKRVLDELKDPLIHLIRNSIDHGIEAPDEREKSGKNRVGRIGLKFRMSSGNKAEILVVDDGRGIDIEKIKDSVVKKGIKTEEELALMKESEILNLIFLSDVSTSKVITDLSGRGLGMAIAREKVRKLGGEIRVETEPGLGTTFILEVPVSVSSLHGILIKVGSYKFYIKTDEVIASMRIREEDFVMVENKMTVKYMDKHIALTDLASMLNLTSQKSNGYFTVVIVKQGKKTLGLLVDELIGDEEIIVRPFNKQIKNLKYYEGVSVSLLGDLVPVIKIKDVFNEASGVREIKLRTNENEIASKKILVVDDSITSRLLIKDILENHGYGVTTAVDGNDAWGKLRNEKFDLVVSDVEMPKMDGFELTKKIKDTEKYTDIPVVLVTGLAKREDMEKGIDAGADAYIVKSDFKQSNLLDTVKRLI